MKTFRAEKIKNDIRKGLSEVFARMGLTYVIFNKLVLNKNFSILKVEVSSLKSSVSDSVFAEMLNSQISQISKELSKKISSHIFPSIIFQEDSHSERVKSILEKIDSFQESNKD